MEQALSGIRLLLVTVLLTCCGLAQVATARSAGAGEQPRGSSFRFGRSPVLDLHMLVRTAAADPGAAAKIEGIAEAAALIAPVEEALGGSMGWGLAEPLFVEAADAAELVRLVRRMPETHKRRDGTELRLREPLLAYAEALEKLEPAFRQELWPEREKAITRGEERLRALFAGREADCMKDLVDSLGMRDPRIRPDVFLVAEAPFPAAFTHRGRNAPMCIVGVAEADDSILAESVLHELIHAMDISTAGQPETILNSLRAALNEAGLGPAEPAYRDFPHTLMFVQAAATVRTRLDPQHVDYGEARGYYAKVPAAAAAVRSAWTLHLSGEIDRAEAVKRIIAAASEDVERAPAGEPAQVYVFPYFLDNGQDGIYLALSRDGVSFIGVNDNRPIVAAPDWHEEWLTRDPSILYQDGTFHLVWTTGWRTRSIGYSSSKDLVSWQAPRRIELWGDASGVKNTWAPELHWDPQRREHFILFSSTVESELADGDGSTDPHGHDHRIYATRTTDFERFTPPALFYSPKDPEHGVIDAFVALDDAGTAADSADDRWIMVIKNEMGPENGGKNLRLTFADHAQGPYGNTLGEPIVGQGTGIVDRMAEGPTLLKADGLWRLYWDAPGADADYCLATSPDLVTWTDRSAEVRMPVPDPRHGTVLRVPISAVGWLEASGIQAEDSPPD